MSLRTLLIVAGAVAVLGFAATIAVTTTWGDPLRAPSAEASAFFADVRRGDLDAARARMAPRYRATHDAATFRSALSLLPGVLGHRRFRVRDVRPGQSALVRGELTSVDGGRTVVVNLVRVGDDRYAIESVEVDTAVLR